MIWQSKVMWRRYETSGGIINKNVFLQSYYLYGGWYESQIWGKKQKIRVINSPPRAACNGIREQMKQHGGLAAANAGS